MGRVTRRHAVVKIGPDSTKRRDDLLAVEEPLEVRLDGTAFSVTMRTPGHDIDLVHGLLHGEQIIHAASDVVLARYCAGEGPDGLNTYNVLDVTLAASVARPDPGLQRNVLTTSACGICGATSIEAVTREARYDAAALPAAGRRARAGPGPSCGPSSGFSPRPAGLHAAGLMAASGEVFCVREDVGRHNAVDKVIGWALRENRLPLSAASPVRLRPGLVRTDAEGGTGRNPGPGCRVGPQFAGRRAGRAGRADPGRLRPGRHHERLHPSGTDRLTRCDIRWSR